MRTHSDPILEDLTLLCTKIFQVPGSLVSLLDETNLNIVAATGWQGPICVPHLGSYCGQVFASGQPLLINDPEGSIFGIRFYAGHPIRNSSGNVLGSFSAIDFTTDRHPTPEQLDSLALLASQAAARIESLALRNSFSTLAHEIRTPLNGILGAAEILFRETQSPSQLEVLEALRGSGQILLQILNDALESSRTGQLSPHVELKPLDLPFLLQLLIRNFTPLATANQLKLTLTCAPNLPEIILSDKMRLSQILQNLIGNALKFTPPSGTVHVSATLGDAADAIQIAVTDNGPGIEPNLLQLIFDPYVQGPASQFQNAQGSGLGLGLARDFATALNGKLDIQSQLGLGTSVRLELPLRTLKPLPKGLQILLVEDDNVSRFVTSRLLTMLGCKVASAHNGEAALNLLTQANFDAVVMDCQMPVMDGLETTRRIRKLAGHPSSQIPIIALTGSVSEADYRRCLASGMNAVLPKPVKLNSLHYELRIALQSD